VSEKGDLERRSEKSAEAPPSTVFVDPVDEDIALAYDPNECHRGLGRLGIQTLAPGFPSGGWAPPIGRILTVIPIALA
jgi:hypothetical protein